MRFPSFRKNLPADAPPGVVAESEPDVEPEGEDAEAEAPESEARDGATGARAEELEWSDRARAVIPDGASTGSKRADALYGPDTDFGPTHFVRAEGSRIVTPSGAKYIDCTMALGAVAIGYA